MMVSIILFSKAEVQWLRTQFEDKRLKETYWEISVFWDLASCTLV
jgi:hypothetical protein